MLLINAQNKRLKVVSKEDLIYSEKGADIKCYQISMTTCI
jgi:hypothetical protein